MGVAESQKQFLQSIEDWKQGGWLKKVNEDFLLRCKGQELLQRLRSILHGKVDIQSLLHAVEDYQQDCAEQELAMADLAYMEGIRQCLQFIQDLAVCSEAIGVPAGSVYEQARILLDGYPTGPRPEAQHQRFRKACES